MKTIAAISASFLSFTAVTASAQRLAGPDAVERIYVVRSVRLSRVPPTDYCAERQTSIGASTFEDQYEFKPVTTQPADGAVTSANGSTIGHLHACFARRSDSLVVWFAEGDLNGVKLTGRGDCRTDGREFPEPGILSWRCYLDLTGLPTGFTGGQLTTNTIQSRANLGAESDPPGYVQPSIATIRLWRRR